MSLKKFTRKKKIWLSAAFVAVLIIGSVLYKLADRYLIEHVEVQLDAPNSTSATQSATAAANAKYDDANYESDDVSIHVDQAIKGSGEDQITYYVADVTLRDGATLQTALAKNAFGRNITENTSTIATNNNAILAINGDYYGFRSDGVVIRNGTVFRDEPARDGLALFKDGTMLSYDESQISSSELVRQGVTNTFSFGPILLKEGTIPSDFSHVEIDTNFGNHSIQGANPRTGIGMISPNHYVLVVVDGRSSESKGMTLAEFAQLFKDLGCTEAYNLDGGGSSTMYFMGKVVNNPQGREKERGVSDIIYVGA
ncbi:phosphodiester glycosidase family protein [Paenibacillus sp. MMS18-CY102]|uniref:phosphodiester glycosidase family protein n=1 Tax=Paenibacillus sp. MMS18-CY102 TaxID=2682849 RepID=UPI0013653141|nr:phosphodiester glycosidase family protein [Paenibacillus sp. MMS18-CY102]MWC26669.1 phosphodiester glycosidase family protein [Paenibacillus sp. MMS18-CY102]